MLGGEREVAAPVAEVVVVEGAEHPDDRRARPRAARRPRASSPSAALAELAPRSARARAARRAAAGRTSGRDRARSPARTRAGSVGRARRASPRASGARARPIQSSVRTRHVLAPRSGPRQSSPSSVASSHRWTLNSFAVVEARALEALGELRPGQRALGVDRVVQHLQRPVLTAAVEAEVGEPLARPAHDRLARTAAAASPRPRPAIRWIVLRMHPGAQQRTFLGPRAVDVGRRQTRAPGRGRRASPRAAPAPASGRRRGRRRRARRRDRGRCKQLRGGARPGQDHGAARWSSQWRARAGA